jgi:hypothetical protein
MTQHLTTPDIEILEIILDVIGIFDDLKISGKRILRRIIENLKMQSVYSKGETVCDNEFR